MLVTPSVSYLSNKIVSYVYSQIPTKVEYMGIQVNPHTVLDKQKIIDSVKTIIDDSIIEIISTVTKYTFVEKISENYYIWKKEM